MRETICSGGTATLVPAAWTDVSINDDVSGGTKSMELIGSIRDLLSMRTVFGALLNRREEAMPPATAKETKNAVGVVRAVSVAARASADLGTDTKGKP